MAITAESLADGSVLTLLIMRFNGMQTEENLMSVLQCLRDSHVWAPMSLLVKDDETNMLREAKEGDVLLLAGKGHENYIIDKDGTHYFSEKDVIMNFIERKE